MKPSRTPAQKIATAKRLLLEATREIRVKEHLSRAADRCACGHRRDEHTVSWSINYTEGFCMVCPEVKRHSVCQWFNYQPNAAGAVRGSRRKSINGNR